MKAHGVKFLKAERGRVSLWGLLHSSMRSRVSAGARNHDAVGHSARSRRLNASICRVTVGLPGRERAICTPFRDARWPRIRPAGSGPLSTFRLVGLPRPAPGGATASAGGTADRRTPLRSGSRSTRTRSPTAPAPPGTIAADSRDGACPEAALAAAPVAVDRLRQWVGACAAQQEAGAAGRGAPGRPNEDRPGRATRPASR